MNTTSYWRDTQSLPRFPKLREDSRADVVVIGAGITGVTTAYLLKRAGMSVILVERDRCGGVDTSYTSGHLTQITDLRLHQLADQFGRDHARAVWDAGGAALDQIADIQAREGLKCEFRWVPAYLFDSVEPEAQDTDGLKDDIKWADALGISAEYRLVAPPFGGQAIQFSHQAIFHPLKYLRGLLQLIPGDGCSVFEHTEVTGVGGDPFAVLVGAHRICCDRVVLATQTPQVGTEGTAGTLLLQSKLARYTTYVLSAELPARSLPEGLFWDTAQPYNYLRTEHRRGFQHLIIGGEDHKTGQEERPSDAYARLEKKVNTWFPEAKIKRRWSGQVVETSDGLPYIGRLDERIFVAAGFAGNGLTFGTLAATMAVDTFSGIVNPWAGLFDPHRSALRVGAWNYLKENKDYPYYLVRNWIAEATLTDLAELKRGQGQIVSLRGQKVAAYRDPHGAVTLCSPICTHLNCIVNWNDAEQTWDCPCHGSRFQATGEVMAGPAQANLEQLDPTLLQAPSPSEKT